MRIKHLFYLSFILGIAGCKQDAPTCQANSHLEGGICVCDSTWFGQHCDRQCDDCGSHGTCQYNTCVCDSGWIWHNCEVPVGTLVGRYYMVGTRQTWAAGQYNNTYNTSDTLDIVLRGDKLFVQGGYEYMLDEDYQSSSPSYTFSWFGTSQVNSYLSFSKVNGSLSYSFSSISPGGGSITNMQGAKL